MHCIRVSQKFSLHFVFCIQVVFLWKWTIKGSLILSVFIYLHIYICYSYSLKNGIPLVKESAVTNLVEHPIQLRPPSKHSLACSQCLKPSFCRVNRIFVKKFPVYCMKWSMYKFMNLRNRMRIRMHIRYYVFKPCQGHLKVGCLYGTGLARVNRTIEKWINFLWHIVTTPIIMVVLTDFTNRWW